MNRHVLRYCGTSETLAIADNPADTSSRLGRLIHDATVTLKMPWPVKELVEAV